MKRLVALLTRVLSPVAMAADTEQPQWELIGKLDSVELRLYQTSIQPDSVPVLNQYNPPWTVPFLRSNEVSVVISLAAELAVVE